MSRTRDVRRGFTLVELLVVISIIGVLMGLLLPAINSARESGRKTQCLSNLKNLGYASLQSVEKLRRFPSGGWGTLWVGYADGGNNLKQPGGWVYNILPYLEETALHDAGQGTTVDAVLQTAIAEQVATSQSIMSCPTRRQAQQWTANNAYDPYDPLGGGTVSLQSAAGGQYLNKVARGDYAANAGVRYVTGSPSASANLGTIGTDNAAQYGCVLAAGTDYPTVYKDNATKVVSTTPFSADIWSGVIFQRSIISDGSIKDGLSKTYLIGEKFVDRKHSEDGQYGPDAGNMYSGMGPDNYRNTLVFPASYTINADGTDQTDPGKPALAPTATVPNVAMLNDQIDTGSPGTYQGLYGCLFGSAHGGIVNFVFCDGSAKSISVGIDPLTHRYLGERNDGKILDDAMIGQ